MFQQLVRRIMAGVPATISGPAIAGTSREAAAAKVLCSDPFDLILHMEQVWDRADPWASSPPPASAPPNPRPAGRARRLGWQIGEFDRYDPAPGPAWDHFGYSYVLENSRAFQIMRRVVREYRSGEGLGVPSVATQRWLDATETLLYGAANPISAWLSTSTIRPDAEAVRRNAYWRMFGLDLAFGTDDNRPPVYDKANAHNGQFLKLFEELLFEIWKAISNVRNIAGINESDDDRIYRLAEQLQFLLRSRRQFQLLAREELAAAAALGWIDLTLSADTPVVLDMRAQATSPAERLRLIGERVNLAPHSKSEALFSMASDLSVFLRVVEAGLVSSPSYSWIFYLEQAPLGTPPVAPPFPPGGPMAVPRPIGEESRRLITEWSAATGKNLKAQMRPLPVANRRELVTPR